MNLHELARREAQSRARRALRGPLDYALAGLGADFPTLNQIPQFQAAWGDIAKQVQAEGGSQLDLQAAQDTLVKTFTDLTTTQFGLDSTQALASAKQFTMAAKTVAGAVTHIEGLISAAQAGAKNPAEIAATFQMFTGTLIGLAGAAGAFSAGVGALIVTGIGIALNLLESAGLFGHAPQGQMVCNTAGMQTYCTNPDWVIGCDCVWGPRIAAGAANWRAFPDPTDTFWFGDPNWPAPVQGFGIAHTTGAGTWKGATWGGGAPNQRAIDTAFPDYYYLEIEQQFLTPGLEDFQRALFSAWKANKEYALNGLQVQPDWQVLLHLTRVWNRSHEPGQVFSIGSQQRPQLTPPSGVWGPIVIPKLFTTATATVPPFAATLVGDVLNNVSANDPSNYLVNGQLQVHTGPIIRPKIVVTLHLGTMTTAAAAATSAAGMSTGGKVLVATGATAAAAAVGVGIYAWARDQAYGAVWDRIWNRTGGRLIRGGR